MADISRINSRRGSLLASRRTVSIELPEFAIRALLHQADLANENAPEDEQVTFNDVVEWNLLSPLSVKEMPGLEEAVPGFTAAFTQWLFASTYAPLE